MKNLTLALVAVSLIASPALAQEKKQPPVGYAAIKKCLQDEGLTEGKDFRPFEMANKDFGASLNRRVRVEPEFANKQNSINFCMASMELQKEQAKQ